MNKSKLYTMFLEELEERKDEAFLDISEGKGTRELRNYLYELMGVIDSKRRTCDAPIAIDTAFA